MKPSGRAVAAGVLVVAGALVLWAVLGRGANLAFADVLQQIREIRTVRYKETITSSDMTGESVHTSTSEVLVADRYRSRSTLPEGQAIITDFAPDKGLMLTLNPQRKRAMLMRMTGRKESEQSNLLDRLLKLDEKQAKPIGRKEIAGCLADGFRVDTENQNNTIWIDCQTRLPIWVEWASKPGYTPSIRVIMTDFEWNVAIDESLVSMTVPPGYEQNDMSVDLSNPGEKDLLAGLKSFAELSDNRFPDDFSMKGFMPIVKAIEARKETIPQAERGYIAQRLMPLTRAFLYAGNTANGQDWHYAGKGIPLGQAGTPVLWYRPKDSPTYRVIYADLSVADVQPADVPTVESVTIQPFPTPPAETRPAAPTPQPAQ